MHEEEQPTTICGLILDYVAGSCKNGEKLVFERHLPYCDSCRSEIAELRTVWEALPSDMERLEPPSDLKQQVMDAVLAAEPSQNHDNVSARKRRIAIHRIPASVTVAVLLAIVLTSSVWNYLLYQKRITTSPASLEQALTVPAATIERLITLNPQTAAPSDAYGIAGVVENGKSKQFVVYVFKAKATIGNEAYQVWLIRDNKRKSAGTFRVDDKGVGILSMPVASEESLVFDGIGITLEPDDRGNLPRGTKMFSSTL
ncbi:anti-sigma factor [Paenibacillus lautus]|uniref:anti-sigma factor domain-containing protein n=1 Tax=Paenibacillus lautus TaxID=1401 RepID=UPI003D2A0F29